MISPAIFRSLSLGLDESEPGSRATSLEQAVSDLFEVLRLPVYRYLVAVLNSPTEAEDLTQEVFLRLFSTLRDGILTEVRPWVFRVAHNLAIDRIRKQQGFELRFDISARSERDSMRDGRPDPGPNAEERVLEAERRDLLISALDLLSFQERRCLELRAEGLRYREIAEVLAIRIPTVQTLVCRAVKKIAGTHGS